MFNAGDQVKIVGDVVEDMDKRHIGEFGNIVQPIKDTPGIKVVRINIEGAPYDIRVNESGLVKVGAEDMLPMPRTISELRAFIRKEVEALMVGATMTVEAKEMPEPKTRGRRKA